MKTIPIAALFAALLVSMAGAQGAVCSAPQIANYSGTALVKITGDIGWVTQYYSFVGFNSAQIVNPDVINYTQGSMPGSGYLIYVNYKFDGPINLTATPALVFVLVNNTQRGCLSMKLFAYNDVVMPYNPSSLVSPQQATSLAQKQGYNVTFGPQVDLVPAADSGMQLLAPGYKASGANYTVYANADNGTISSSGYARLGSNQTTATATSGIGSFLSGIYRFLVETYDFLRSLLSTTRA